MALFSERNGYVKPSEALIRESMPEEVCNAIASIFDILYREIGDGLDYMFSSDSLELHVWCNFFNKRRNDAIGQYGTVKYSIVDFILNPDEEWYSKLDLLEFCISYLDLATEKYPQYKKMVSNLIEGFNSHFLRLNYAYRFVGREITEISSKEDIDTIQSAINESKSTVKTHLSEALKLYSKRPEPDYRNSIKESISAVETVCRELTGESSLGGALKRLESNGIFIHGSLKDAFIKLYTYTNQPDTGIRHSLMDDAGNYTPTSAEAYFMLVSCSAFVNYIRRKK